MSRKPRKNQQNKGIEILNMSKLTTKSRKNLIEYNRKIIYYVPRKYKYLNEYLKNSWLRDTLLKVYSFIADKEMIIANHKYLFFADNTTLSYRIRNSSGTATTSRHMNLLCALGLFQKHRQSKNKGELIKINENFFKSKPYARRSINVYSVRKYTEKELKRIESRARRLYEAHITAGNFSQSMLALNGLENIAIEVLPYNDRMTPVQKLEEYKKLVAVLNYIVKQKDYALKEDVYNNLNLPDAEIDKLFKIFKNDISKDYCYKRPTKQQIKEFNLQSLKFIYTKREKNIEKKNSSTIFKNI